MEVAPISWPLSGWLLRGVEWRGAEGAGGEEAGSFARLEQEWQISCNCLKLRSC